MNTSTECISNQKLSRKVQDTEKTSKKSFIPKRSLPKLVHLMPLSSSNVNFTYVTMTYYSTPNQILSLTQT